MANILHRIVIDKKPEIVYRALVEHEGLTKWWTKDCDIGTGVGDVLKFRFVDGTVGPDMKITKQQPFELVKWECVDGIDEWIGTELEFKIKPHQRGSVLLFSQRGWQDETEFYMHCNCKWAFFLGVSLKNYLETGRRFPHPHYPDF